MPLPLGVYGPALPLHLPELRQTQVTSVDLNRTDDEPYHVYEAPIPPCHKKHKTLKKKYVDDLSILESIDLRATLKPLPPFIGPPNKQEVPGLYLPVDESVLQHQLLDLANFTASNKMKINYKKTKIIAFNFCKKYDFLPHLHFPNCDPLEVIHETKLLGVIITSSLSWSNHVNSICAKACKKLWVLVRFRSLGGTMDQLVSVYITRIRSTLEFACPVFHSGLTKEQCHQIELV